MAKSGELESLLLATARPLSVKRLAEVLSLSEAEVIDLAKTLNEDYQASEHGFQILGNNHQLQLVTSSRNSDLIKAFLKDEETGELTKPALETLTIIAYRQPVTKAELEQIRGVNCSLILRNLLIRGLIEANEDKTRLTTVYLVTLDFLKFLGLSSVAELPDYQSLNNEENLQRILQDPALQSVPLEAAERIIKVPVKEG
ncbi:MAG: SMC-Scp complex subunit ScpB [Candidatus Komeilibacteria bacterium]|nr:SMC-Scp complex subunit ScpB [Candidatus Komeilibacteria bacterium]